MPVPQTPRKGRTISVVGDVYRFLATGAETNGRFAFWEAFVPPGGGPPPHVHSREDEGFYVLDGEITFAIGAERSIAHSGAFVHMPSGTPHSFKNESPRIARMLIWVAPAGLERLFFEVGTAVADDATSAAAPSDADIERLLAVAPNYGIKIQLPDQ